MNAIFESKMEISELTRQYKKLTDDEVLRIWADKSGLTDVALSILTEEMRGRGLLGDPQATARVQELRHGLDDNKKRLERFQRRIVRRVQVFAFAIVVAVVAAIVMWMFFQK